MKNIKLFALDVDGTMTDGKIYMSDRGELFKAFDIKDGMGIHELLREHQIKTAVITGRTSKIVENRAAELEIDFVCQGIRNKKYELERLMEGLHLEYEDVAFMGDDLVDLECMQLCGVCGCPADAVKEVREAADYVADSRGGQGAVREFIEWILSDQ